MSGKWLEGDLEAQLRRLVRTEQRLVRSQRELELQAGRVDAMNRFSIAASGTRDAALILELASELFFEVFPFEQALGFLRTGKHLCPTAVRAVRGREGDSAERLEELRGGTGVEAAPFTTPIHGTEEEVFERHPGVRGVLDLLERVFGADGRVDRGIIPVLLLPLPAIHEGAPGLLALRRADAAISFHDPLPSERDLPFLHLVAAQIGVAVSNAQLVQSLRRSYGELARAQQELIERERLAAVGELAAVIAHEVRNPLGSIFNSVATLQRLAGTSEPVAVLLDIVHEEATRLNRIVGELLDFARPVTPELSRESLSRIVGAAVESTAREADERKVRVDVELGDEPAATLVDSRMMHQALVNLLTNAVQQTPEEGTVTVRLGPRPPDDGKWVVVEVVDRGPGIEPEHLGRIFEPFFTTKATGTGLGLAVVKRFIEAQGGEVAVRSQPEGETVFVVRLPRAR